MRYDEMKTDQSIPDSHGHYSVSDHNISPCPSYSNQMLGTKFLTPLNIPKT